MNQDIFLIILEECEWVEFIRMISVSKYYAGVLNKKYWKMKLLKDRALIPSSYKFRPLLRKKIDVDIMKREYASCIKARQNLEAWMQQFKLVGQGEIKFPILNVTNVTRVIGKYFLNKISLLPICVDTSSFIEITFSENKKGKLVRVIKLADKHCSIVTGEYFLAKLFYLFRFIKPEFDIQDGLSLSVSFNGETSV